MGEWKVSKFSSYQYFKDREPARVWGVIDHTATIDGVLKPPVQNHRKGITFWAIAQASVVNFL